MNTLIETLDYTDNELASVSTDELKRMAISLLNGVVSGLVRAAAICHELRRRGESIKDLIGNVEGDLLKIHSGSLSPELYVRLLGNSRGLNAVARMPREDQDEIVKRGGFVIHSPGGDSRMIPIEAMTAKHFDIVVGKNGLNSPSQQVALQTSPVTPRYSQPTKGGVRMDLSLFSGAEIKRLKRVAKSREMTVPQLIREALVKEGIL